MRGVMDLLARLEPNPASYIETARGLDSLDPSGLRRLSVAVAASFTAEFIAPYLRVEAARRGLAVTLTFAPYGQIELQLLNPDSALYRANPDVFVIASRLEDMSRPLTTALVSLSESQIDAEIQGIELRLRELLSAARARTSSAFLVFNHGPPLVLAAGLADPSLPVAQSEILARVNAGIARACAATPNCHVFDQARAMSEFGVARWADRKLLYMARTPLGAAAQLELGRRLARQLAAVFVPPRKCLVLDLDNTLWGGVLGEDGMAGIKLGEDFPGNAFKAFQEYVGMLRARGVLLAIASKNNAADVEEVFARHPDCVLRLSDFAATEIHWRDKASSLAAIAKTLNIGTDSLAFFDDSAVECEWVRRQMPEVAVVQAPASAVEYIDALERAELFDHLVVTAEDRQRSRQYAAETERKHAQARASSVDDFLRSLELSVTIGPVDAENLPRIVQLIGKTNQWNLTTRRHSAAALDKFIRDGAVALWMRVADRYGDSGLVGVALALNEANGWRLDTFLMSCRVIGRRVETVLLAEVAKRVKAKGGHYLIGEYIETKKNAVVAGFFREQEFQELGGGLWRTSLESALPSVPDFVSVREA